MSRKGNLCHSDNESRPGTYIALWVAGLDASLSSLITFLDASSSIIYIMHTLYIIIICVLIGHHRLRGGILPFTRSDSSWHVGHVLAMALRSAYITDRARELQNMHNAVSVRTKIVMEPVVRNYELKMCSIVTSGMAYFVHQVLTSGHGRRRVHGHL